MVEQLLTTFRGSLDRKVRQETISVSADCGSQRVYDHDAGRSRPVAMRDLIDVARVTDAPEHVDEAGTLVIGSVHDGRTVHRMETPASG